MINRHTKRPDAALVVKLRLTYLWGLPMNLSKNFRSVLFATSAIIALSACTQGEEIESPGVLNPGTPPGGGGGGGGGGGTGAGTCPPGFTTGTPVGGLTSCLISGIVSTDLRLPFVDGVAYRLDGRVDIGVDVGADGNNTNGVSTRLTIEPGVVVYGTSGSDFLVVNRGSEIIANGTPSAPIILTSGPDLERQGDNDPTNDDGGSNISEWGGLVILGRAPINRCNSSATPGTVDCENIVEGVTNPEAVYGGAFEQDDSGVLRYVQVRFPGFAINQAGNELNGITFGGVGSETEVEFVQVHNSSDDGMEFFGGRVDARFVVLTGNDDDSLDTDNGWQGNVQFLLINQREDGGDNIVEASSVGPGVAPFSDATISNFTFVGNRSNAWRLNTGTVGTYVNGVVDYGSECFRFQDSAGDGVAGYNVNLDPSFNSVLFDCDGGVDTSNSDPGVGQAAIDADPNNLFGASSLNAQFFPGPAEGDITVLDPTTLGSFFQEVDYVGAFGPDESPTSNWASGWTFALFPEPECPFGTTDTGNEINDTRVCSLSGIIEDDIRLTRGNLYLLDGRVDIGSDTNIAGGVPGSLTIEAGTTIYGRSGSDLLVVNRGSQIFSNGTSDAPVIFTSLNDVSDLGPSPEDAIGEWGGIVILGFAPINRCNSSATPGTAACENIVEGVTNPEAVYGGGDPNDNSGAIRFTQVKFAGFAINQAGNELNGITFGGIGDSTIVENIQVHNNADDGVEFFGGNVNVRNLVLTGNDDDSIDTDNGYQGNIQFAIVVQRANGGDNIVEASSVAPGVAPLSNATLSNFTFVGNRSNAWRLNTGTVGRYVNGVVSYGQECFRYQDSAGDGAAGYSIAADPRFDSVLFDCEGGIATSNSDAAAVDGAVSQGTNNTTTVMDTLSAGFVNGTAETAATPFIDVTTLDPFFEPVTYVGAVQNSSDRWWAGWTCGLEAGSDC